jgi:phosphoglycerate dehydrogenase-like enzyme
MNPFKLYFTGDHLDENGNVTGGDTGIDVLNTSGFVETGFLLDQKPDSNNLDWQRCLYSLKITPEHVAHANGIVVCRPWVTESAFVDGAENLLLIARAGAGYDKIDLGACTRNNVLVFNVPDALTHSTAAGALTLLMALAKKLPRQQRLVQTGRWDLQNEALGDDLVGKSLGIIGLGKTGTELARLVAPFHIRVFAFSPRADVSIAEELGVTLVKSLDELLIEADFLSLHCRLNDRTRGMLGPRELGLLKTSAYLINIARGELIDEEALIEALRQGRIAGAGLDVFETEPLPLDSPLLALDNVILTPHWLPSTHRAARLTRNAIVSNVLRVARGELPQNILNPEVLASEEFQAKLAKYTENRHIH